MGARGVSDFLLRVDVIRLDPGCTRAWRGPSLRWYGGCWWWSGLHGTVGQHESRATDMALSECTRRRPSEITEVCLP